MAELMSRQGSSLQVLQKGQPVTGTIKKLTPSEILMDIGAKGDALVIEYDKKNLENLLSLLKVGDSVTATVISAESEEGFPVVSLRRMLDDVIFKKFENLVSADETFEVEVTEATRGGYFAQGPDGVRGFLPASQVIDQESLVGSKIKVKVIEADRSKKRVVFSQKATLYVTNVEEIKKLFKSGDTLPAEVSSVTPYGLFVSVEIGKGKGPRPERVEGFVHISEISYDRVEDLVSKYKAGEKIKTQVVEVDVVNRRINLSIKKTHQDTFDAASDKFKSGEKVSGKVANVALRGVTVTLGENINGFISADKIPAGTTYEVAQDVSCEVIGVDKRRRLILLSPILKAVPIGYR